MKPKWMILIALVAVVAVGGTLIVAQGGPGRWSGRHWAGPMDGGQGMAFGHFGPRSLRFMTRQLNLTEDQQAQIRQLLQQQRETEATDRQDTMDQLQAIQKQIHDATLAPTLDESLLRQLYSQRSVLLESGFLNRQKNMHEIYALLTPEQQQKFQDLFEARQARGRGPGPADR